MDMAGSSVTYVGTPGRIPPEGPGTPPGDIFSFGKLLYEIGIGLPLERFPELPTSLVDGKDDGPVQLNLIILKACEMDVRKRYQTAAELVADLQDLQTRVQSGRETRACGISREWLQVRQQAKDLRARARRRGERGRRS